MSKEKREIEKKTAQLRSYKVVKSNELIQKARFNLSTQEQKIILYLISKIKPDGTELETIQFKITEFCTICGLDKNNGKNHKNLKESLKSLRDKSIWVKREDGSEAILAFINWAIISKGNGTILVEMNRLMQPYLLQLKEKFTQYEILYILAMKSQYSIKLYELLKSYEYRHMKSFTIDGLRRTLYADNYTRFPDFKRRVIDPAVAEINELSDITITYEIEKEGRKYTDIEFSIKTKKNIEDRLATWNKIDSIINPKTKTPKTINQRNEVS